MLILLGGVTRCEWSDLLFKTMIESSDVFILCCRFGANPRTTTTTATTTTTTATNTTNNSNNSNNHNNHDHDNNNHDDDMMKQGFFNHDHACCPRLVSLKILKTTCFCFAADSRQASVKSNEERNFSLQHDLEATRALAAKAADSVSFS